MLITLHGGAGVICYNWQMPFAVKILIGCSTGALIAGAIYLIALRGPAIILDMAAGAAAFICL